MKAFADLLPPLMWALSIASHVYLCLEHATHKGTVMSEAPEAVQTQPAETASVDHVVLATQAAPVIIQAATSTPGVHQSHAMAVIGNVFAALAQQAPTILQVSRASPKTSAEVGIGFGLFAAIFQALAASSQPQ